MTKKEKDLLIEDICARLPYGVKFPCNKNVYTVIGLDLIVTDEGYWEYAVTAKGIVPIEIDFIKPYLFPLSSMTEEQKKEWQSLMVKDAYGILYHTIESYNYLNKHHFDYRGLIPLGLANDSLGLNIY